MSNSANEERKGLTAVEQQAIESELKRRLEIRTSGSWQLKDDGQISAADKAEWERAKAKIREQIDKPGHEWQAERDALIAENEKLHLRLAVYDKKVKEMAETNDGLEEELAQRPYPRFGNLT